MVFRPGRRKALLLGLALFMRPVFPDNQNLDLNRQTLKFQTIPGPIANPLMGWAPWATIQESKQPHSLVYADLTWRELEAQQGVFDFDAFERKNQFERWRAENQRVVFRFLCDRPGKQEHLDIPNWLFQATGSSGDRYNNEYGQGFSPNYASPLFIQYHREAIKALGQRYAKDDFIAYIELGSLGHWGEWHVQYHSGIRRLPLEDIRDQYVRHYREAFPHTHLLMRRPFKIAKQYKLGLYNDMAGDFDSTQEWLDWIANGGVFNQTKEENALTAMPDAYRSAPVGGEQSSAMRHEEVYGSSLEQTIRLHTLSHTTFVGPNCPYSVERGAQIQAGVDRVLERIGYRISIRQVRMPSWVLFRTVMNVAITFANDGIAPLLYNWPVQISLFDENGEIRKTHQPEMDLRKLMPGAADSVQLAVPLDGLRSGRYSLGFAILDPRSGKPAVRLANANPREDLVLVLGAFDLFSKRTFFGA